MEGFGRDLSFDMDEAHLYSRPQAPDELYLSNTMHHNSQSLVAPSQRFLAPDSGSNDSMNFVCTESHRTLALELLPPYPVSNTNNSTMALDPASAKNFLPHHKVNRQSKPYHLPLVLDPQPLFQDQTAQSSLRKRAAKAATISAEKWKPHYDRIKQLYVREGKSVEELRRIMNEELSLDATLRQYNVQIKNMNLEKNAKANERKAVVKHLQHREHVIRKKNSKVRVRGHDINQERLFRWVKENLIDLPFMMANPPSPLPSCISIYTDSVCETLKHALPDGSSYQLLLQGSTTATDMTSTILQRLLKYAGYPKHTLESHEARHMFNDLQTVLSSDYIGFEKKNKHQRINDDHFKDSWNPNVNEDIVQIRNMMNTTQALLVGDDLRDIRQLVPVNQTRSDEINSSQSSNRHAAWRTPYGRVEASFWVSSDHSSTYTRVEGTATSDKVVAARLAIVPSKFGKLTFRTVFDFNRGHDPCATITYQAMIPSDSEVFRIAQYGDVGELLELLNRCTASLTDRDEEGRSLLNYAMITSNVELCKFLVEKKADVNAIELNFFGYIGPVHAVSSYDDAEVDQIERLGRNRCISIALLAGADLELEKHEGEGMWINGFVAAICYRSHETVKHMLEFGEPFINPSGIYKSYISNIGDCTALMMLSDDCGYDHGECIDVVEKAILLLTRGADISCRDENGNTVLHILFKSGRLHEKVSHKHARRYGYLQNWIFSIEAPKDLLIVFITAGADVYATNDDGETPSMVAAQYGRVDEWMEALDLCGYDPEKVFKYCPLHSTHERQTSNLSFQEYCQQRKPRKHVGPDEEPEMGYVDEDWCFEQADEGDEEEDEEENSADDGNKGDNNEATEPMEDDIDFMDFTGEDLDFFNQWDALTETWGPMQ